MSLPPCPRAAAAALFQEQRPGLVSSRPSISLRANPFPALALPEPREGK